MLTLPIIDSKNEMRLRLFISAYSVLRCPLPIAQKEEILADAIERMLDEYELPEFEATGIDTYDEALESCLDNMRETLKDY